MCPAASHSEQRHPGASPISARSVSRSESPASTRRCRPSFGLDIAVGIIRPARHVPKPRAAISAKPAFHCFRRTRPPSEHPGRALHQPEIDRGNHRRHGESGTGLRLTFGAVTGVHRRRRSGDLITNRAALTASGLREVHGSLSIFHRSRLKLWHARV